MLWVLGIEFRLNSKVLARILSTRARLLSLPIVSSIHDIARGATKVPGATWLDDAAALLNLIDVRAVDDFLNFSDSLPGSLPPKIRIRQWIKRIVLPVLSRIEGAWRTDNLDPALQELAAHEQAAQNILAAVHGTKREWQYARCWYLSRLLRAPAFRVFGFEVTEGTCCSHCQWVLTLQHLIHDCPLAASRRTDWAQWLLPSPDELKLSFGQGSCMLVDVLLEQPPRELKMVRLRDCPRHSGLLGASGGIATGLSVCWPDGQPPVFGV